MNDDELRERLRGIDPAAVTPVEPADGPRAAALLEHIMNTPIIPESPTTMPAPSRGRRTWLWASLLGLGAIAGVTVGLLVSDGKDKSSPPAAVTAEYTLSGGVSMGMCININEYVPEPSLEGFRGVVTAIEGDTVTLQVSEWYRGGPADHVVLHVSDVPTPALDGIEFVTGGDYLVAVADDGAVRTCGISGLYSADLAALYAKWFGA